MASRASDNTGSAAPSSNAAWLRIAVVLGLMLAGAAATLALMRYYTLGNTNSDIAFYTRVVWGLANGDRVNSLLGAHDLGLHLMPVMWLFAPLAGRLPIPETLLVTNALAIGAVVPLLFRLGRRITGKPYAGMVLAIGWMLFPTTLQLGCREFHPSTLALPLLVAAFDALHAQKNRVAVICLALACLAREDVALVGAGAGAAIWFEVRRRKLAAGLISGGLLWFAVYILIIQPGYLPADGSMQAHFPEYGDTAGEVFLYLLTHPLVAMETLIEKEDIVYSATLLACVGGLPLLAPKWLLPALPPLLINLVSDFPASTDLRSHYATLILPGLFMATAVGLGRFYAGRDTPSRLRHFACAVVLVSALIGHVIKGATPLCRDWSAEPYVMDRNEGILSWYARDIRNHPELTVMGPAKVINHLAERRGVYSWAFDHPKPDVAILDIRHRQWVRLLPERWEHPKEREIQRVDADPAYGTWRKNPPYRVAWRGVPGGRQRVDGVSPERVPATAVPQGRGWPGALELVALEASLGRKRERFTGLYQKHIVVRTTFYWRALELLPPGLLLRIVVHGETKSHVRYLRPTWGIRDTGTWAPGELIKDAQWCVSPGGWPLQALSATVQFVHPDGTPFPVNGKPIELEWGPMF